MADQISLIIRAILEKTSAEQLAQELKNIEKKLDPITIKTDIDNHGQLDKFSQTVQRAAGEVDSLTEETRDFTKALGITVRETKKFKESSEEAHRIITKTMINEKEMARVHGQAIAQNIKFDKQRMDLLNRQAPQETKILNTKEIDDYLQRWNNAVARMKIGKESVFNDPSVSAEMTKLNAQMNNFGRGAASVKNVSLQMDNLRTRVAEVSGAFRNVNRDGYNFISMLTLAGKKIAIWGVSTSLIYGSLEYLRAGLRTLHELDTALVEIAKVTDLTSDSMERLVDASFDVASAYGSTAQAYLKSIAAFSRAGYEESARGLAEVSLLAQNVGELTEQQANDFLLATDAAYKYAGSQRELTRVLDGVNQIDNEYATSIQKISQGMTVAGSVAANAGIEIDELTAAIGTMTAVTQRSGNEAGRAFRSILMNIRQIKGTTADGEMIDDAALSKSAKALDSVGVKVRELVNGVEELRNPMDVLSQLAGKWEELSSMEQAPIIDALGGKYRANQLVALLENFDMYEDMLEDFAKSTGSALIENEKRMDSWSAKSAKFSNTIAQMWRNTIDTDIVKKIIDFGTAIISLVDKIGLLNIALVGLWGYLSLSGKIFFLIPIFDGLAMATGKWALSLGASSVAAGVLATAMSVLAPLFAVALIAGAVKVYQHFTTTVEEQSEKVAELTDKIAKLRDEQNQLRNNANRTDVEERYLRLLDLEIQKQKDLLAIETKRLIQQQYYTLKPLFIGSDVFTTDAEFIDQQIATAKRLQEELTKDNTHDEKVKIQKELLEVQTALINTQKIMANQIKLLGDTAEEEFPALVAQNKAIYDLFDITEKTNKQVGWLTESLGEQTNEIYELADAYKTAEEALKGTRNIIQSLFDIQDELTKGSLSGSSMEKVFEQHKSLIPFLSDEVLLRKAIQEEIINHEQIQSLAYDAMIDKNRDYFNSVLENSEAFFNTVIQGNSELRKALHTIYGEDLSQFKNLNDAKLSLNAEVVKVIGESWAKLYGANAQGLNKLATEKLKSGMSINDPRLREVLDLANAMNQIQWAMDKATVSAKSKLGSINLPDIPGSKSSSSSSLSSSEEYSKIFNILQLLEKKEGEITKIQKQRSLLLSDSDRIKSIEQEKILIQDLINLNQILLSLQQEERSSLVKQFAQFKNVVTVSKDLETLSVNTSAYDKLLVPQKQKLDDLIDGFTNLNSGIRTTSIAILDAKNNTNNLSSEITSLTDAVEKTISGAFTSYQNYLFSVLDEEIDRLQRQQQILEDTAKLKISAIQSQIDLLTQQNDLLREQEERSLKLLDITKQREYIANVEREKNVRIVNESGNWEWIANPQTLRQEQDKLKGMETSYFQWEDGLRRQKNIDALQAQIKAIQDELSVDKARIDARIANLKFFIAAEKILIEDQNANNIRTMEQLTKALEGIDKIHYDNRIALLTDFIARYNSALSQMSALSTETRTVYGNSKDLATAQSVLGTSGYRFVNTEKLDTSKINFSSNDIVVGGTAARGGVSGNIGGATRIAGTNAIATMQLLENFKKQILTFHTGGMPTEFSRNDSGVAIVKRKEIILNEADTKNFLQSIKILRDLNIPKMANLSIQQSNNKSMMDGAARVENYYISGVTVQANDGEQFINKLVNLSRVRR